MICKNCKASIPNDSIFCPSCGQKVEAEPVVAPAPTFSSAFRQAGSLDGSDSEIGTAVATPTSISSSAFQQAGSLEANDPDTDTSAVEREPTEPQEDAGLGISSDARREESAPVEDNAAVPAQQKQPVYAQHDVCMERDSKRKPHAKLWLWLPIVTCIVLLVLVAVFVYNNSGAYSFANYDGRYTKVVYRGKSSHLVDHNYELLEQFMLRGTVDGTRVRAIECNDYTIINGSQGGTVDILEDTYTFYEEGLRVYNKDTAGSYYDRFRNDYVCYIKTNGKGGHEYYFVSCQDALEWIKQK